MAGGATGVDDGPDVVIPGWIGMKCTFINEEFLQGYESLALRSTLGDAEIHLLEVLHNQTRVFQVVFVADESPCPRVLKNVLKLSHSIKEVHWENHSPNFS
jgi:hypothetical protein